MRRRIELADAGIEGSKQPYHAAEELALGRAEKLIRRCEAGSRKLALQAFREVIAEVEESGRDVVGCGLLLASGRPLGNLADTLASHAKIHTADGEHFREAISEAAERCGLTLVRIREREAHEEAARKLRVPAAVLGARIAALGKSLGPPWRQDEKLATLAGCLALASFAR